MYKLNLPKFEYKVKKENNQYYIFDILRKKYVCLTPEEWVRQHLIHYLINNNYPTSMIAVERELDVNGCKRRFDLVVYKQSKPWLLVECKAPTISITQEVFEQALCYNTQLCAPFLAVTNGIVHYCVYLNKEINKFEYIETFPLW